MPDPAPIQIPIAGHTAPIQVHVEQRRDGGATVVAFEARHQQRRALATVAIPPTEALPSPVVEVRKPHVRALRWELEDVIVELLLHCDSTGLTSSVTSWPRAEEDATDEPAADDEPVPANEPAAPAPKRPSKKARGAADAAQEPPSNT